MQSLGVSAFRLLVCAALLGGVLGAQETRGTIYGRVLDPQSAAIPAAAITVTNIETNTAVHVKSNETGYYEASLLLPGSYQVTVEASGFKTVIRKGIVLPVGTRVEVSLQLTIGTISDSITVEANAIMLDTENGSAARL